MLINTNGIGATNANGLWFLLIHLQKIHRIHIIFKYPLSSCGCRVMSVTNTEGGGIDLAGTTDVVA